MDCKQMEALLGKYRDGLLDIDQQDAVQEHLQACPDCQQKLLVLKDCQSLFEGDEVPVTFSSGWRQAITREEDTPVKQSPRILRLVALAAALFLLVGGTWLAGQDRRLASQSPAAYDQAYGGTSPTLSDARTARDSLPMAMAPAAYTEAAAMDGDFATLEKGVEAAVKIIRTAQMELSTRNFDADNQQILTTLKDFGGRVENTNLYNKQNGLRTLYLSLRIPTAKLDEMIAAAKGVGRLVSYTENAQDVTDQHTDLAARLSTQQAKMERLQVLLKQASNMEDLIAIENSISDTQYQLDSLAGQLAGINSKVDYATLSLILNELSPLDASRDQADTLWQRIENGVSAAWDGFVAILGDLVVFLSVALPYLVGLATLITIIRLIVKRRNK